MKIRTIRNGMLGVLLVVSPSLFAETSWYVGIGAGRSDIEIDTVQLSNDLAAQGHTVTAISKDDTATTAKLFAGLRFLPRASLELGYMEPGTIGIDVDGTSSDARRFLQDLANQQPVAPEGAYADLVGRYPLAESIYAVGRIGTFIWESNISYQGPGFTVSNRRNGVDTHFGIGLEFAKPEARFGARVEWERFDTDTQLDFISISAYYNF